MRLIDADELQKQFNEKCIKDCEFCPFYLRWITEELEEEGCCVLTQRAPTIDAVPVIRCKDCKHRGGYHCPMFYEELWSYDEDSSKWIEHDKTVDNGFCHRGERREQNESE